MSVSTTVTQTAVMPKGVLYCRPTPVDEIHDAEGIVQANDFVFIRELDGETIASTSPIGPDERFARVGDTLHDGSTVVGAYIVNSVSRGVADLQLMSTVPCSVHDWCRGHRAEAILTPGDDDWIDATEHHGPYQQLVEFREFEESKAMIATVDQAGTPVVDVSMDVAVALGKDDVEGFAAALEALVAKVRKAFA